MNPRHLALAVLFAIGCGEPLDALDGGPLDEPDGWIDDAPDPAPDPDPIDEPPCEGDDCPITVRVRLTVRGPDTGELRWLSFAGNGSTVRTAPQPSAGILDFEARVRPGVHAIRHHHAPPGRQDDLGRVGDALHGRDPLVLRRDTELAYAIDVVEVTGEVTVDGRPLPPDEPGAPVRRGYVRFVEIGSYRAYDAPLPPDGPARYRVALPGAGFSVSYHTDADRPCLRDCPWTATEPGPVPPGIADADLAFFIRPESHRIEWPVDLRTIEIRGRFERAGDGPLPVNGVPDGGEAAAVVFTPLGSAPEDELARHHQLAPVRTEGDHDFSVRLFPGVYRVEARTNGGAFQDAFAPDVSLPTAHRALELSASGALCPLGRGDDDCRRWPAAGLFGEAP